MRFKKVRKNPNAFFKKVRKNLNAFLKKCANPKNVLGFLGTFF